MRPSIKVGIDYGGSLIKVSWVKENFKVFNFRIFDVDSLSSAIHFIQSLINDDDQALIGLTGGGAIKNSQLFQFVHAHKYKFIDEMQAIGCGLAFCLPQAIQFPFILANIGSGVSILKFNSITSFSRISGTPVGGATFAGLGRLISGVEDYHELLKLAQKGNNKNIDLTVRDIYGGSYDAINLTADLIASNFGAIKTRASPKNLGHEDLLFSLLQMISFNLAQILSLNAAAHDVCIVCIFGGFVESNSLARSMLEAGIKYWSCNRVNVIYGENSAFLGSIGAIFAAEKDY